MKIQVNSDKNIAVNAEVIRFVRAEVNRILGRFAKKLTRVEVHLSDVNSRKSGTDDKRCLIEARPARHRPVTVSTGAATVEAAVRDALSKMQSLLQTFFGRLGRQDAEKAAPMIREVAVNPSDRAVRKKRKRALASAKKRTVKKTAASGSSRGPKKKGIYLARRKSWPRAEGRSKK